MTDAKIARMAFHAYRNASPTVRGLQALRPSICPIERLLVHIPPGSHVLDVGCGAGLLLLAGITSGRVASGCGVDISERSVAAARTALGELAKRSGHGMPIEFQCASGLALPDEPFDVVTLVDVTHHVPPAEQRAFFTAAAARVRPHGLLLYKDMCAHPWWKAWGNRLHDLVLAQQWIHYVPLAEVARWAEKLGFSVAHKQEYSRLWYGHELLVLRRR